VSSSEEDGNPALAHAHGLHDVPLPGETSRENVDRLVAEIADRGPVETETG
jgi:hypothetical protein